MENSNGGEGNRTEESGRRTKWTGMGYTLKMEWK